MRRQGLVALGMATGLMWCAAAAGAPKSRLSYAVGESVEGCPDVDVFRRAIVLRLGEDPFGSPAEREFRVVIDVEGERLVGRVALVNETGTETGLREFAGAGCAEVVEAMALAISLAHNPELLFGPDADAEPVPSPAPIPSPLAASRPSPERSASPRGQETPPEYAVVPSVGAFVLASVGAGPEPAVGVALAAGARWHDLSVALEGRYDAPSDRSLGPGASVHSTLLAAALVPCVHWSMLAACGVGVVGRIQAETAGLANGVPDAGVYSAAGVRLALQMPLDASVRLELRFDGLATLIPVTLLRNQADELWRSPPFSGVLGLGLVAQFP